MSKYIIHHKTKFIHHSSFVCDACQIPSYEHQFREDTLNDEYVQSLIDQSYTTCPHCLDYSSSILNKVRHS